MFFISSLASILSSLAFSTFKILPLSGRIACVFGVRAILAEPPAESPSTRYISQFTGSLSEQSASLPGRRAFSSTLLRRTSSLAFLAASLALAATRPFSTIVFAICGFSSKKYVKYSVSTDSTAFFASLFPRRVFVCPSNWGSVILTLITAVIPSLTSSPERFLSASFISPMFLE
ncbi:hypothetical protein SDC9_157152 [bioreactor metagenome]|uniref:Uncharacterized protein n=1 Tax=bioreactor metagenome TaxID=1076179 RepID=A0A645F948_9ZZZZ